MLKFILLSLVVVFGASASNDPSPFDCVVDLYLASQDRGALLIGAARYAQRFEELSYLGTTLEDRSRGDRIIFVDYGVPFRLNVGFAKEGQKFHYFSRHRFASPNFDSASSVEGMVLAFQKIVAGPGAYVESPGEPSWYRTTHPHITGVFLFSPRESYPRDFVKRYGLPLKVELPEGTPIVLLETGVYVVPGPPNRLVVPVKAAALSESEKAQLTEGPKIEVTPATRVRAGLR